MAGTMRYYDSPASVPNASVHVGAAVVYDWSGQNLSPNTVFAQLFDVAGPPLAGAVPIYTWRVLSNQTWAFQPPGPLGDKGRRFALGIHFAYSSTQDTLTPIAPDPTGTFWCAYREAANP